jgi:hypothetical protein
VVREEINRNLRIFGSGSKKGKKMKRLIILLVVLVLCVGAYSAPILVYKISSRASGEFGGEAGSVSWKGYLVIDTSAADPCSSIILYGKVDGAKEYEQIEDPNVTYNADVNTASIGLVNPVPGAAAGKTKSTDVGGVYDANDVAKTMKGGIVFDDTTEPLTGLTGIGGGALSLKLDSRLTKAANELGLDEDETQDAIIDALEAKGYAD